MHSFFHTYFRYLNISFEYTSKNHKKHSEECFLLLFLNFSNVHLDNRFVAFEGFDGDAMLVENCIRAFHTFGRKSYCADAYVDNAVLFFNHCSMEVSVKHDIALFCVLGRKIGIAFVSVREVHRATLPVHRKVGIYGKFAYHLVDFAVAIAFDDGYIVLCAVEHFGNFHRRVAFGERIARTVVVDITQ